MEKIKDLLNTYRDVEATKENEDQFTDSIIKLVKQQYPPEQKKTEIKSIKPESLLKKYKRDSSTIIIEFNDNSSVKGKLLDFDNYCFVFEEEDVKGNRIVMKHSIRKFWEVKE